MSSAVELISHLNASLTREQNKLTGSFYTPPGIAETIVGKSISKWLFRFTGIETERMMQNSISEDERDLILKALRSITVLDPSVGEGVFLVSAGEWILNMRLRLGDTTAPEIIRSQIASDSLYGVDIQGIPIHQSEVHLQRWISNGSSSINSKQQYNIMEGNSLLGRVHRSDIWSNDEEISLRPHKPFHWHEAFPRVFDRKKGFDVIIGNPPYGNLLSPEEKKILLETNDYDVMSGKDGTWNAASLFIARTYQLLNEFGELGFLVPNSILRVGQFQKIRRFLLSPYNLWRIVDEGNPFDDVTLEMVSIFCSAGNVFNPTIEIHSRRKDLEGSHDVNHHVFASSRIFPIYHDEIFELIQSRGTKGILKAVRGRDIPVANLEDQLIGKFTVPYATKGRSIHRYRIEEDYLKYADDWFLQDYALSESYNNEFLVATKNFPYPRCIIKPKGMIHGGGIVRIIPIGKEDNLRAIGLVLNSRLSRFVCTRYLTNYSQLTTCLNTGIIDEFPIVYPEEPENFAKLFDLLQQAYSENYKPRDLSMLDSIADALVFSAYFSPSKEMECILNALRNADVASIPECIELFSHDDVLSEVDEIFDDSIIRRINKSPRMN